MQISVFVESLPNNVFRVSGAAPFAISAEGTTRAEALAKLKAQVHERLRAGEIVTVEISPQSHPLAKYAGMFKDDTSIQDWEQSMAEYRRKTDDGLGR